MFVLHKFRKMQFLAFSHTEVGKRLQNRLVFCFTVKLLRVGAAEKRDLYVILPPFLLLYNCVTSQFEMFYFLKKMDRLALTRHGQ